MTIKLSNAQVKALNEIHELGYTTARKNTIASIAKYVTANGPTAEDGLKLNPEGLNALGVAPVEALIPVNTDWNAVEQAVEEEYSDHPSTFEDFDSTPVSDIFKNVEDEDGEYIEVYNHQWADWERELGGFQATIGWKGTEVWDGLTAAEIQEDMETAYPVGRAARRVHHRTLRNAYRRMTVLRPRKALKVTGAKGL